MPTYDYICEVCGRPGRGWRSEEQGPPRFCGNDCKNIGMIGQTLKHPKYTITPEIHERIRKVYRNNTGNGEVAALARELGFPRWKVSRHAREQGWVPVQRKEPMWTEAETAQLQRLTRYSPDVIQRKMAERGYRRSVNAIVNKIRRLNMRKNISGHSSRDVAQCLGIDDHAVTRAIALGKLKATRRGTARTDRQGGDMWYILDQNIRKYVLEYLSEIDIRKVDKWWFVDLIAPESKR